MVTLDRLARKMIEPRRRLSAIPSSRKTQPSRQRASIIMLPPQPRLKRHLAGETDKGRAFLIIVQRHISPPQALLAPVGPPQALERLASARKRAWKSWAKAGKSAQ